MFKMAIILYPKVPTFDPESKNDKIPKFLILFGGGDDSLFQVLFLNQNWQNPKAQYFWVAGGFFIPTFV